MDLKEMTFDQLAELKQQVEAEMRLVIEEEQNALYAKMQAIGHSPTTPGNGYQQATQGKISKEKKKAAIKYQHPADSSLTWAGRGLKPRWLSAEIEAGKTIEDFCIAS